MKYIVITTVNPPSEAVRAWSKLPEWQLIVVGDRGTPKGWSCEGAKFLSLEEQRAEFGELADVIPESAYARKSLGYAWAIRRGATAIFETDDDNAPYAYAEQSLCISNRLTGERLKSGSGWINIHRRFGANESWPRGFPLQHVRNGYSSGISGDGVRPWSIKQFMTDGDPDVDAVYRMTNGRPICFARRKTFILDEGAHCPINSQAALWMPDAYPLMFLPLGVPDRTTDIIRGYVATECLWRAGHAVGFASPVAYQNRNAHDLFRDFTEEGLIYANAESWAMSLRAIAGSDARERYLSAIEILAQRHPSIAATSWAYELFMRASGIE